jgi:hypothetical protein
MNLFLHKRTLLVLLSITVIVLLLVIYANCLPPRNIREFTVACQVHDYKYGIQCYSSDYQIVPECIVTAKAANLNSVVTALLYYGNPRGWPYYDGRSKRIVTNELMITVDSWGPPLNVFISAEPGVFGEIRIWSNGPNMTNEYGRGDDINSWTDLTTYRRRFRKQHVPPLLTPVIF